MHLKFVEKGTQKSSFFSKKANFERSPFLLKEGSFVFLHYKNVQVEHVNATIENQEIKVSGISPQGGRFNISGHIQSKENFDLAANIRDIPSPFLDYLVKAKGFLYAALGPTVDLSGSIRTNQARGEIHLDLSSSNATLSLAGELIPFQKNKDIFQLREYMLRLTQPLHLSLHISPTLNKALFNTFKGNFITSIEAKNPITLDILSGASISFGSTDKTVIQNGQLDLGKVLCTGGSSFVSFFSLLHKGTVAYSQFPIWFTPVTFSISQGILYAGRIDALVANAIHFCAWGNVDLVHDQLNMYLGLPADTLANSFGIERLSKNYVLKIPVRGSLSHPNIDKNSATAKITALIAAQEVAKRTGIFGNILDVISQPKADKDVPPPHRPFPWNLDNS